MERSLTIDGLDPDTFRRLESEAHRRGIAVAVLAGNLLRQLVESDAAIHHDLDALAGTWSDDEVIAFECATAQMRQVDTELWR
ncbi:MAG TPA: hypothetical protein VFC46_16110 [Humisphaera sp.]|nr:hypothetical protein [Humisphaera sp.]